MPRCGSATRRPSSFPRSARRPRSSAIRDYGAELVIGGARYAEALAASERLRRTDRRHADPCLQPGRRRCSARARSGWRSRRPADIDTLLVAVGGGGLIGGIAAWFAGRIHIVAVEPEGAPTLYRAFEAGQPVDAPADGIAADSLAPKRVGELMFPIAEAYVERSILVTDDEIVAAQKALWDGCGSSPSRVGRRPSRRSCPGTTRRPRANASPCWSAGRMRTRQPSDCNHSAGFTFLQTASPLPCLLVFFRLVRLGLSCPPHGRADDATTHLQQRSRPGRAPCLEPAGDAGLDDGRAWLAVAASARHRRQPVPQRLLARHFLAAAGHGAHRPRRRIRRGGVGRALSVALLPHAGRRRDRPPDRGGQ